MIDDKKFQAYKKKVEESRIRFRELKSIYQPTNDWEESTEDIFLII